MQHGGYTQRNISFREIWTEVNKSTQTCPKYTKLKPVKRVCAASLCVEKNTVKKKSLKVEVMSTDNQSMTAQLLMGHFLRYNFSMMSEMISGVSCC